MRPSIWEEFQMERNQAASNLVTDASLDRAVGGSL